jgi:uncharacterized delta-60 repeat protein
MSPLRASFLVAWLSCHAPVFAQTWQSLAGQMSGTPAGVGPQPQGGSTWLAATATGAYRSTDNGQTWTAANTGLLDPGNGITLANFFLKTPTGRILRGGDNSSWNNSVGSPLWYSDDDGLTWAQSPLPFGSVATNPAGIGFTAFTVHGGAIFASDQLSQGVWKSTDDGLTWTAARNGIPTTLNFPFQATVLSSITSTATAIFATGIATGIHRSTDGGANWSYVGNGLGGSGVRDIVALNNGTLFARVNDNSLFRSTDNGDTWVSVSTSLAQGSITSVATDGTRVFAFTSSQKLLETTDGGNSFSIVDGGTPPPLRTSNRRQLAVSGNTALYSSDIAFWRLDLSTAPRTAIAPAVITPPVGKGVNVGGSVTLSVVHSAATLPLAYQWKLGGTNIPGANGPTYTLSSATPGDAGSYTVEISNAALPGGGTTVSAAATVIVEPATPGSIDYTIQPIPVAGVQSVFAASDGSVWFGGSFLTPGHRLVRLRPDGTRDTTFAPGYGSIGTQASILAVHQLSDGSVLAGGGDGGGSYLRKLRPDGSIDTSFASPAELAGITYRIEAGPGDTCYVAGAYGIYRISSVTGEIDFTFNPPGVSNVLSFAVTPDGKITIAGSFGTVNSIVRPKIARLHPDGTLDLSFDTGATNSGFNGDLTAVAVQKDGKIVATGAFTSYRGTTIARVARLLSTGEIDPAFTPPVFATNNNGRVLAMTLDGEDRIVLGGVFTLVDGTTRNNIIRLNANGTLDATFPSRPDPLTINTLAAQPDGKILVGTANSFYRLLGATPLYPSIAGFTRDTMVATGQPASFTVSLAGPSAGATYEWFKDGVLLPAAVSNSLQIPSASVADIGRHHVRVTVGSAVLESDSSRLDLLGAPYFVRQPSTAPGYFGYPHLLAAEVAGSGPMTYQWYKDGNAIVGATGGGLSFTTLAGADAGTYYVRATGSTGSIESMPFYLKVLPRHGTVDPTFRFNLVGAFGDQAASFITLPDGKHLIGGFFNPTVPGSRSLFRLLPDGTLDTSFDSGPLNLGGAVRWLYRLPGGKIIVGSDVRPIRLNEDLTLDTTFNFPSIGTAAGSIQAMALLSNGGLLVQGFSNTNVPGYASKFFRTTPSGAIDTTFPAIALVPTASITALSEDSSGRILLAGSFTQVAGQSRLSAARLSSAGVLDATFTGPAAAIVTSSGLPQPRFITEAPDGAVFLGGERITRIGAAPAGRVVKLSATTGEHDPTFYPSAYTGSAFSLRFLPNGKLALAGLVTVDSQNNQALYEVLHPNGARDRRELGSSIGSSVNARWAAGLAPGLPGTDILPGIFTIPEISTGFAARLYTGDVDLGIVSQTAITSSSPAIPGGTPADTVIVGTNVTLGALALGSSAVTYQWHFNGTPIPGATAATLARNPVLKTHEGTYTVVATNASGSVTTRAMHLDVLAEPEILTQPLITPNANGSVTLTVTAKGRATLSYAWTKDGVTLSNISGKISGATTNTLTLSAISEADAGAYRAVVTNPSGTTTSNPADLIPATGPGSVDPSWTGPYPVINSNIPTRVLPTPDGGFYVAGGDFVTVQNLSPSTRRHAMKYNADGTANTTFAPTATTLQSLTSRSCFTSADGTLHVLANNGITATTYAYRYDANGALVSLGTISAVINDAFIDANGQMVVVGTGGFFKRYTIGSTSLAVDTTFNPVVVGTIYGVCPSPSTGGYYINGAFTQVGGQNRPVLARVTSAGALDTGFSFDTTGQQAVGGRHFVLEAPSGKVHFRNIRLESTGARDTSWNETTLAPTTADVNRPQRGLFAHDGKLLVVSNNMVRRLLANGDNDSAFTGPAISTLFDLAFTTGGQLYLVGYFNGTSATYNRPHLVRLNYESADIGFTSAPTNQTVNSGSGVTFTATTYGTGITYKWFHRGVLVTDGGRYSGATTASLTMTGATEADAGSFRLEITNAAGLRSRTAFLTVNPPPAETFATWQALATLPVGQRGPNDDPDGDGLGNLLEFALSLPPGTPGGNPITPGTDSVSGTAYPTITFTRRKVLPDVTFQIQATADLTFSDGIGSVLVSVIDNGDGTETVLARSTVPLSARPRQYLRVKVESP